jgi:uncharacterized protein YbjT (DUF2867 family)
MFHRGPLGDTEQEPALVEGRPSLSPQDPCVDAQEIDVCGGTADAAGGHGGCADQGVGPVVARLIETPLAWGRVLQLAGAGVTSQQAMVDEIARQVGRPVKVRAAGKWLLRVLGLFNPLMREMVEMHYLLTEPVIMDDSALQGLIGPIAKTPYPEGIRQTLAAMRQTAAAAR